MVDVLVVLVAVVLVLVDVDVLVEVDVGVVTVPGVNGSLDLSSLVKSLHPVYVYDQHRDSLAGADIHAFTVKSAAGTEWVHACAGVVYRTTDGIGGPMGSLRVRWDNVLANAESTAWMKAHTSSISIPQIEAGPFGGYINRLGWLYGGTVALAF